MPRFLPMRLIFAGRVMREGKMAGGTGAYSAEEAGNPGASSAADGNTDVSSAGTPKPARYLSLPFSMIPSLAADYVLAAHKSRGAEFAHTAIVIPE